MWDRDFLNKWDMGRRIEARLFCFGSGDTDEPSGGSDNDSGGRQPGDPVVFGVDGVSKTGSTSRDAAIGFTDGSGGQGANFDALQNANRSQTNAAVAAANAAAQAGGDIRAQNNAARSTLNNVSPDLAAERAVAMQNTFGAGAGVAQALGMGPNAARVTPAEEAAMNALVGNNVQANAVGQTYNPASDMGFGFTPLPGAYQAPINTIDTMLDTLARMEARDAERRAMFGGQTAADVQALNAQAGEVYYDETTGTYKAGPIPDTRPQDFANASITNNPMTTGFGPPVMSPSIDLGPSTSSAPRDVSVSGTNLPPATITDMSGTTFNTTTGEIVQPTIIGMEDEYDPFAGTGKTAMDVERYDTTDQTNTAGFIRPFAGLTRAQQANLEGRDDFVARNILAAQTPQPSGIPTTNLTGIFTYGDSPEGDVRGYSDFGPNLPFLGQTQVYTGFGDNPYALPAEASDDETVPPVTNPMTDQPRCPDGYIFDDDLQACRLDVSGSSRRAPAGGGDIFYRRTALDDAPANVPSGFDFNAANRRFTQSYGYRPDFYRSPMSLTGFTRLT